MKYSKEYFEKCTSDNLCISCGQKFSPDNVFTEDGYREIFISGMCELCFDSLFDDIDDE